MKISESKILILLGMHRSGTSLTANWLHHCGLNLGEEFIKTDVGNTEGYYEDQNFVRLHKSIYRSNDLNTDIISSNQPLLLSQIQRDEAKEIVKKRNAETNQWGWKDPRTCLFLDFWDKMIPNAKVLVVFRHYDEVVDSLIRRKAKAEKKRKNFLLGYYNILTKGKYRSANYSDDLLKSWIKHNRSILDYLLKKEKKDYLIINSNEIHLNSESIFNHLKQKFKLNLTYYSFSKIYKENLMRTKTVKIQYNDILRRQAEDLYLELNEHARQKNLFELP